MGSRRWTRRPQPTWIRPDIANIRVPTDESHLIVTSRRPDAIGQADLYISFRNEAGTWSDPVNLGKTINPEQVDSCPMMTPDGKYLFSSRRWGNTWDETTQGAVYSVDARMLDRFRPQTSGRQP